MCQFIPSSNPLPSLAKHELPTILFEYLGSREQRALRRGAFELTTILEWVRLLKKEVAYWKEPDPWGAQWDQARQEKWSPVAESAEDRPFTVNEIETARQLLLEFRDNMKTKLDLSEQKLASLEYSTDLLIEQSSKANRLVWLTLVYGILGSWILSVALPSSEARELLFELLNAVLTALFPEIPPPPPGRALLV